MKKVTLYRTPLFLSVLLIRSLTSWGSEPLPQLSLKTCGNGIVITDTVPPKKPVTTTEETKTEQPVKETTDVLIKEVPKSKKQMKPVAIPSTLPVKTPKIIKPKVVIKKIGSLVP